MKIYTKMARAGYDDIEVRGRSILGGQEHQHHPWSMVSIALGHREFGADEAEALNLLANVVFIGDPRLWPFRAQRLVGAFGDSFLSLAAISAFYSGAVIGPPAGRHTMEAALSLAEVHGMDPTPDEVLGWVEGLLARGEKIPGYNVVGRDSDERRDFMLVELDRMGWLERPWFRLFSKIDAALFELKGVRPNAASTGAAILLEVGLTPERAELMAFCLSMWSAVGNAEECTQPEYGPLQRLPDDCVVWQGSAPRVSPKARLD